MRLLSLIITLSVLLFVGDHAFAQAPAKAPAPDTAAAREVEPDPNDFVDVEEEPQPIVPIESLIEYPEAAKKAGIEGRVTLLALVSKWGRVTKVEVSSSDNDLLKEEAVRVMKAEKFSPAKQAGKPVSVWVTRTIVFKLADPQPGKKFGNGNPGNKY